MKMFLGKRWLGIPVGVILVVVLVTGVALAATIISNVWVSPDITVTEFVPPPENEDLVISSPDFTAHRYINTGGWTLASVQTVNPSPPGAPGYTDVLFEFAICKTTTIAETDVVLEYEDAEGVWQNLPLSLEGDKLVGTFGPTGGFPVEFGYNETTELRAKFTTVGTYHAEVQAVGTSG